MVFYAGKLIRHPKLENPTIVVLTDRIDLDGQLFGTFSRCEHVLRQTPEQAENRDDLKSALQRSSGGVVFTTIQKFFPEIKGEKYPMLSDRRNIVVIADEAHRSQYDFIDGFAKHMRDALPNASFIGFTGTPIESGDRSTQNAISNHEYRSIPITALAESTTNPRKRFDPKSLEELAASFKTQGILAPLLVRELEESKYEVVAGARRLRAAKLAELEKLPVRMVKLTDAEAIEAQ